MVLWHQGLACADYLTSGLACGVKIEVFRTTETARQRLRELQARHVRPAAEIDVQDGALLLRLSNAVAPDDRSRYIAAFRAALCDFPSVDAGPPGPGQR